MNDTRCFLVIKSSSYIDWSSHFLGSYIMVMLPRDHNRSSFYLSLHVHNIHVYIHVYIHTYIYTHVHVAEFIDGYTCIISFHSVTRRLTFEQCRALAMPTPLPETESFSSPRNVLDGVSQLPCSSSNPSPAYQGFSSLSKLPESKEHLPTLPLPYKFNLLAEKF